MQLSVQTGDQINSNMVYAVTANAAAGGFTINATNGSVVLAIINACRLTYLWLQWLAIQVLTASRLATCVGADCDSFGADFGFVRLAGAAASGSATFSRYSTSSAAIIPVGATVKTTDGTQLFEVVADSTNLAWQAPNSTYPNGSFLIPAGSPSVTVTVQNAAVGAAGNIIAGAIGLVASVISGVDTVSNGAAFTNGMDSESDTAFKVRFGLFLVSLAKSTPIAVESAVLSVAQNLTCAVLNQTATFAGASAPGYFLVCVDDGSGATPSATLSAVAAAVFPITGLGAVGSVIQAPVFYATVVMTISAPNAALKALAVPLVSAAISSYINSLPVSTPTAPAPLPYNILSKLAFDASPYVTNVTGITLNGSTSDLGGQAGSVVRVAGVTVD